MKMLLCSLLFFSTLGFGQIRDCHGEYNDSHDCGVRSDTCTVVF